MGTEQCAVAFRSVREHQRGQPIRTPLHAALCPHFNVQGDEARSSSWRCGAELADPGGAACREPRHASAAKSESAVRDDEPRDRPAVDVHRGHAPRTCALRNMRALAEAVATSTGATAPHALGHAVGDAGVDWPMPAARALHAAGAGTPAQRRVSSRSATTSCSIGRRRTSSSARPTRSGSSRTSTSTTRTARSGDLDD